MVAELAEPQEGAGHGPVRFHIHYRTSDGEWRDEDLEPTPLAYTRNLTTDDLGIHWPGGARVEPPLRPGQLAITLQADTTAFENAMQGLGAALGNVGQGHVEAAQRLADGIQAACRHMHDYPAQRQTKADAEARAVGLLHSHLSDEQRQTYEAQGYFEEVIVRGGVAELYRFDRYGGVWLMGEQGQTLASFCIQTVDATLPYADQVLAKLLLLRVAPDVWHATANRSDWVNERPMRLFQFVPPVEMQHYQINPSAEYNVADYTQTYTAPMPGTRRIRRRPPIGGLDMTGLAGVFSVVADLARIGREIAEAFNQVAASVGLQMGEAAIGDVVAEVRARRRTTERLLRLDTRPPRRLRPVPLRQAHAWGHTYLPRGRGPPCGVAGVDGQRARIMR